MVVGETQNGSVEDVERQQQQHSQSTHPSINQATIDNIMSGIENTGAVKMNNHRKKLRQRFDIIKKLGQGTYGKVQLGINKETGQEVAIKTIKKSKIETEADLIRIRREVQIMSSVQHPNIIHIYEVFENREKMVLVMEFAAGGELYDYLSERKVLTEEEARRIFRQVSTAIYYCHKHKICHRDLKLENILLDEHGNAKIADFGLSNVFDEQRLLATFCGSPLYASPEIVKGTPYQGPEVDCWSLGVLLYTLVYGAMPFDGANFKRLVKQISQGDYFEPKSPSRASPLIREMLTVCPIRRANIEQICSHWWVNEDYNENCLDLAEELANQTPVRLDVLLSLAPSSVTSEQVVVPNHEDGKERIQKSHSVGSIIDIAETEAERRILDMVAAGGEAAIMPSPTRTITPQESPMQQPKRKLESTVSTENATGGAKKKEKPISEMIMSDPSKHSIPEVMEVEPETPTKTQETLLPPPPPPTQTVEEPAVPDVQESLKKIGELCDELMEKTDKKKVQEPPAVETKEPIQPVEQVKKEATKKISSPVKRDMVKHKTSDLSGALSSISKEKEPSITKSQTTTVERKNSLPDEQQQPPKTTEKRRSRILETAEKFQNMNNQNNEKYKKFSIPGVSVGNFKKEFERKASLTDSSKKIVMPQRVESNENDNEVKKQQDTTVTSQQKISPPTTTTPSVSATAVKAKVNNSFVSKSNSGEKSNSAASSTSKIGEEINANDSKSSVISTTMEEARRSMENSIKLLQKAKAESQSKDVDKLCARTESFSLDNNNDREKKLQAAREIIGNAIPPSRLIGIRKPPLYGLHGRSVSGGVISPQPTPRPFVGRQLSSTIENSQAVLDKALPPEPATTTTPDQQIKTSHAEITLKSATLPRRKPASGKMEIQVEIKPRVEQQPSSTSSQASDIHSAPIRETPPTTYTSFTVHQNRSTSVEPQMKEHIINIQKPPTYQRNSSNASYRTSTLSRQSTNESNDSDTPTQSFIQSSSTIGSSVSGVGDKQPIKKSPREFIIPISVEGGGIVTPKVSSSNIEQQQQQPLSDSQNRIGAGRPKRISSIFNDSEEDLTSAAGFSKLHRHTSIGRESDSEEPRFHTMHRLRSSRPTKRSTIFAQDPNESDSGDEDDDDDGFELLTAENLFSTLLSRVRALTHRLNVNNETTSNFPSTRFMNNLRQTHQSPFWNNDPFGSTSRTNMHPWRTNNLARDLHSDFDSMFSRSGATLPRGKITKNDKNNNVNTGVSGKHEILDLGDLDLSQLRLTKKDLETLSSITPNLSKNIQDQLLAQLPPNQAKKLSRTLSMQNQNNNNNTNVNNGNKINNNNQDMIYRRSISSNPRELINRYSRDSVTPTNEVFDSINNNTNLINTSLRNATAKNSNNNNNKSKYFMDDSLNNNNNNNRERTISPPPLPSPSSEDYREKYVSTSNEDIERACFSPPPLKEENKKTKRYSRIISNNNENSSETQKFLREMRERSQERNLNHETDVKGNKISYYLDKYATSELNKALDTGNDPIYANITSTPTSSAINDKILDELNSISLLNNQLEKYDQLEVKDVKIKRKKSPKKASGETVDMVAEKSRIARPKSFVSKELSPIKPTKSSEKLIQKESADVQVNKLERPKSFPNSKFVEVKKLTTPLESNSNNNGNTLIDSTNNADVEPKKVKKIIKVVKKSSKKLSTASSSEQQQQQNDIITSPQVEVTKEKSPDKKNGGGSGGKGLLYTLGQKFEKLRDTSKSKSKEESLEANTAVSTSTSSSQSIDMKEKKKKLKAMLNEDVDEMTRQERKSKIDALIKNLKEKSIPHSNNTELTESGLIKRAVSVEEMPNAFNKNAVNKVLGLFKRIEKENENKTNRVQNTKSTSYLSSIEMSSSVEGGCNNVNSSMIKERPKSGGFIKRNGSSFEPLANICESKIPVKYTCPDCKTNDTNTTNTVIKRHSNDEEKERLKNNRKGLMLDFSRFKSPEPEKSSSSSANYSFPPPLPNDINNITSPQTPTRTLYDNLTNYSSNAFHDMSTSSLSPTNEDIGYDGWSTCSDDHTTTHPLGSLSLTRLRSTQSQGHDDPDESVVDRIRRKSFYSRFNEKKAKRISTIVGPAAKEYYRERSKPLEYTKSATSVIADLSSSRASSVEPHIRSSSRYATASSSSTAAAVANRSLSQTRPSKYEKNATSDISNTTTNPYHHRRSENNHLSSLPPPYQHVHHTAHHHHFDDITTATTTSTSSSAASSSSKHLKSNRNTMYDSSSTSSSTNNTPSLTSLYAKRRSFVSSSTSPISASNNSSSHYSSSAIKPPQSFVDGYATIGRKMRQYNTRSVSLLDPSIITSSSGASSYTTNTFHDIPPLSLSSSSHHRSHLLSNGYSGDSGNSSSSSRTLRAYARTPSVTRTGDNI